MSLLTTPFVKTSCFLAGIYLFFNKNVSKMNKLQRLPILNLDLSEKIRKVVIK